MRQPPWGGDGEAAGAEGVWKGMKASSSDGASGFLVTAVVMVAEDGVDGECAAGGIRSISTVTPVIPSPGWASGIRSAVRFTAWMPAMRATASASPFFRVELARAVYVEGLEKSSVVVAVAERWVGDLEATEIICASPDDLRCESLGAGWCEGVKEARVDLKASDIGVCVGRYGDLTSEVNFMDLSPLVPSGVLRAPGDGACVG